MSTQLARRVLWVVLAAAVGAVIGAGYGFVNPAAYQISGEVQVSADFDLTGGQTVGQVSPGDVATQQALLNSQSVRLSAREALPEGLGESRTTTAADSSVIGVTVTAATPELASKSIDAYLNSYLDLVASQQEAQINSRLSVLDLRAQAADGQLGQLDAAVASTPGDQRAAVVGQQSAERASAVAERLENQQRASRLRAALDQLPVNVQRLSAVDVAPQPSGLALWQWSAVGALLAAGAAVLVIMRLAERQRR